VPFGEAQVVRPGRDVTVVSYGRGLTLCSAAAGALEAEGIDVEVIDLRCLHPFDWKTIEASVRRTGRVLFVNEDTEVTNFGEHLIRRTVEELFLELAVAPALHAGAHVPGVGLADSLENASVPTPSSVINAMREVARRPAARPERVMRFDRRGPLTPGPRLEDLLTGNPGDFDHGEAIALAFQRR
jgi:2-oxoisovalerate dehydrogenase E1 component beta subunit